MRTGLRFFVPKCIFIEGRCRYAFGFAWVIPLVLAISMEALPTPVHGEESTEAAAPKPAFNHRAAATIGSPVGSNRRYEVDTGRPTNRSTQVVPVELVSEAGPTHNVFVLCRYHLDGLVAFPLPGSSASVSRTRLDAKITVPLIVTTPIRIEDLSVQVTPDVNYRVNFTMTEDAMRAFGEEAGEKSAVQWSVVWGEEKSEGSSMVVVLDR